MERGPRLGTHAYTQVAALAAEGRGCTFTVVRRDVDGRRCLLQLWAPRPTERILDNLRADYLQRFSQAEPMDTGAAHLGFDEDKVWFLQELNGTPLTRLWAELDRKDRAELRAAILESAAESKASRLLWPEVIGLRPGRILAPRILGETELDAQELLASLPEADPAAAPGPRPWADPPDLADSSRLPTRGRTLELTYLKSLMLGLGSAIPMERVVLLLGEAGLGQERLCDWAAAAAETEGIWVSSLDAYPHESAGAFLERLVQDLIAGAEAELYAELPAVARALSRRLATFAFLHGGRRADGFDRKLEFAEVEAARAAMAFAQGRHRRLIVVRRLENAEKEVSDLVKDLVLASKLPWLLSSRSHGPSEGVKSFVTALRNHAEAATMVLDRLEDSHLVAILGDLLGRHDLAPALVRELAVACLGNPGLLQRYLELAQANGSLVFANGRWTHPPDAPFKVEMREDMVEGILAGRLLRLNPAALALVRYLALADQPLPLATLGRALGVDADAVEEALNTAVSAKVALVLEGGAGLASAQVRDLTMANMPAAELPRGSRRLLKALEEDAGKPVVSVRLLSFAVDPATALAQVLQAIEVDWPGPQAARRIVEDSLKLNPSPRQEARLWEFLSDNLALALEGDGPGGDGAPARSPFESALAALDRSILALAEATGPDGGEAQAARLQRKKGQLELRLRRFQAAAASLEEAGLLLADHPFHPEQPRLCLVLGRLHLLRGQGAKGIKILEEGLRLLGHKPGGDRDHVALLAELGQAQAQGALFQGAQASLEAARRLVEHSGDQRTLVRILLQLGMVYQTMGGTDSANECMRSALTLATALDDQELLAMCHLHLGIQASVQQFTGTSLGHLDRAFQGFATLGDQAMATQAQAWKARTLAVLGDPVMAELMFLRSSTVSTEALTPMEKGDRSILAGEIASYKSDWPDARRHFQAAANRFSEAGLVWRERFARLKGIQAEARGQGSPESLRFAWMRLEGLKGPVEASGSRWLEVEWHRAHALVLSVSGNDEAVITDAVLAWGEVLAGARELRFPALTMEASARSLGLLMDRGERLGARSRAQDACAAFQEIWSKLPGQFEKSFMARGDIQKFREAVEAAGIPLVMPERVDPMPDWNLTQANLPPVPSS